MSSKQKYEQKIKDRDNELKMLSAGKVQTGEVLPQDRKLIDDLQAQNDKNYFNLISINDKNSDAYKQAYAKYQSGLRDTQDAATWAQHRYVGRKKLESEKNSHYIYVMSVLFFSAFLAEAAGGRLAALDSGPPDR